MKVHLIGIGGTGMGALARLLKEAGHDVRGSDTAVYPPMSDQLAAAQIEVFAGFSPDNLRWRPDCVVVGNICSKDHPEAMAAAAAGLPLESFPSILAKELLANRDSLVVAGTHGKTTTTSLVAWILRSGGLDPSFLIGGVPEGLDSGAHLGKGAAIVLEGDEYDTAFFDKRSKFLHYRPKRAILTSVEYDHVDIFASFEEVRQAFREFVATIEPGGELIVNMDDAEAMGIAAGAPCDVVTYRVLTDANADPQGAHYYAVMRGRPRRRVVFEVFERGHSLGEFSTQLAGSFNLGNIVAAVAMARAEGVDVETVRTAVRRFRGVQRRQEIIGMAGGVRVIADFAHHPTAVRLTVTAVRKRFANKSLHVCFEPRSASSRRRTFANAYAASFDAATSVYIGPLFGAEKIAPHERLDTHALAQAIAERRVPARAFDDVDSLANEVLGSAVAGDTVLLLSSGSFGGLGDALLAGFGDPVTRAKPSDMAAVADLLDGYGLPPVYPSDDLETLVLRTSGGIAGCVSLEVSGDSSFLFGLAVAPERRGQGLGWVLGDIVLRRAKMLGLRQCYLVTNTATDFFASKLGFVPVDLHSVDDSIRKMPNFQASAGLEGAVCMRAELPLDEGVR